MNPPIRPNPPQEGKPPMSSPEANALVVKIVGAAFANFSVTQDEMAQWVDEYSAASRARIEALEGALDDAVRLYEWLAQAGKYPAEIGHRLAIARTLLSLITGGQKP